MTGPRSQFLPVLGHEVHLTEWGKPGAPPIVMWHGLARTGRDFDELAAALSDCWHVICPDTVGRGMSSWARSEEEYRLPHLHDVVTTAKVLRGLGADVVHDAGDSRVVVDPRTVDSHVAPYELVRTMRASIVVLGPLLARFGQADVSLRLDAFLEPRRVDLTDDVLVEHQRVFALVSLAHRVLLPVSVCRSCRSGRSVR